MKYNRIISFLMAALLAVCVTSCGKDDKKTSDGESQNTTSAADDKITMPEGEDKNQEIITNENYADSDLFVFTGTVDEIYEDGSILVYSPDFRANYNYTVKVEFDENSVIEDFRLKENQHIRFEVYSEVKKSEPLTVVASKLTLLNEVSTQREEEAERIARLEAQAQAILNGNAQNTQSDSESSEN